MMLNKLHKLDGLALFCAFLWLVCGGGVLRAGSDTSARIAKGGTGEPVYPQRAFTVMDANGDIIQYAGADGFTPQQDAMAEYAVSMGYGQAVNADVYYGDRYMEVYERGLAGELGMTLPDVNRLVFESGSLPKTVGQERSSLGQMLFDPVDTISGAFTVDEVDISLAGPFPLQIRRNYNSQNGSFGSFGYGWKISMVPHLVLREGTDDSVILAAEMDGTVVEYVKTNGVWSASQNRADGTVPNEHFSNSSTRGMGSTANLFAQRIEKQGVDMPEGWGTGTTSLYTLYGADGSVRRYYVREFPIGPGGRVITRARPYLREWEDNRGNKLTFAHGTNPNRWDYGLLNKIESSNGAFLTFGYNASGQMIEASSNDGRRLEYDYDDHADLTSVRRPDGSVTRYRYAHSTQDPDNAALTVPAYSTHLLSRVEKPEGRVLENEYDAHRRVVTQRATVGTGKELVTNARFRYYHADKDGGQYPGQSFATDWTQVYDAFHSPDGDGSGLISDDSDCIRYEYKDGLITSIRDPLGQTIKQEWYADRGAPYPDSAQDPNPGTLAYATIHSDPPSGPNVPAGFQRSLKRRIDQRGLVMDFWYDDRGNLVVQKTTGDVTGDGTPESVTSRFTYDARNLPTSAITPVDNQAGVVDKEQAVIYDAAYPYLPAAVSQSVGGTVVTVSATTYGSRSADGREARGLPLTQVVAAGTEDAAHARVEFDERGFITKSMTFAEKGMASTPETSSSDADAVGSFHYNYRGELVESLDEKTAGANKRRTFYTYDAMGRPTSVAHHDGTGRLLSAVRTHYTENGEISWIDGPRTGPKDYVSRSYDADGRLVAEARWRSQAKPDGSGVEAVPGQDDYKGQALTRYEYDAFDNLTKQTDPNDNYVRNFYDDIGQLLRKEYYDGATGELLKTERFEYEPGGKVSRYVNPSGGVTRYFYTASGQPRRQENPDGTVRQWRYTIDGRLKEEILPSGAKWVTTYTDAFLQTVAGKTCASKVERAYYNPTGVYKGSEIKYLDRRGNVICTQDLDGYLFASTHDGLGRPVAAEGPEVSGVRQTSSWTYDNANLLTTTVNALSESVVTRRDAIGRVVERKTLNASAAVVNLATWQYADDHNSVTAISGDPNASGEFHTKTATFTDTLGKTVLVQKFSGASTYDVSRSVYDKAGNLIESIDEMDQPTRMEYDGRNRLAASILPDGARTEYAYDPMDNLARRVMPGGLTWQGTFDNAGRIISEALVRGSAASRKFAYHHYDAGPYIGLLHEYVDELRNVTSTTSEYDDFLRPKTVAIPGSGDLYGLTKTYVYDKRGNTLQVSQNYEDAGLADSTVSRTVDGYGQILTETVSVNGVEHSVISQRWNAAGRRQAIVRSANPLDAPVVSYEHRADGVLSQVTEHVTASPGNVFTFGYDRAGFLNGRTNPWRASTVNARDLQGRPTGMTLTATDVPGVTTLLAQSFAWRPDGRLESWAITRGGLGTWNETREFAYDARGLLIRESFAPAAGESATIDYGFDGDRLGVRTSAITTGDLTANWRIPIGGLDQFARVRQETVDGVASPPEAWGYAKGAGKVQVTLRNLDNGGAFEVTGVKFNPDSADGKWSVPLDVPFGPYELTATAVHPSGGHVAGPAVSRFEVTIQDNAPSQVIHSDCDDDGYVYHTRRDYGTNRYIRWDVLGRLISIREIYPIMEGYQWVATYDPIGRRLKTQRDDVAGSIVPDTRLTIASTYDPEVEFLEIGVSVQRNSDPAIRHWKVYGPDANGAYGALQGIGGLEATILESDGETCGTVNDVFGHRVAFIGHDTAGSDTLVWGGNENTCSVSGYGPLPGTDQPKLLDTVDAPGTTPILAEASVWQGRRIDPTGLYYLGARYYDPQSGKFISPDPAGHAGSMDLYSYANGDPINQMDPDGRLQAQVQNYTGSFPAPLPVMNYLPESDELFKPWYPASEIRGWVQDASEYQQVPQIMLATILQQENVPTAPMWRKGLQFLEREGSTLYMGADAMSGDRLPDVVFGKKIGNQSSGFANMMPRTLRGAVTYTETTYERSVLSEDARVRAFGLSADTRVPGADWKADLYYAAAHLRELIDRETGQTGAENLTLDQAWRVFRDYNGSGPPAEKYANDAMERMFKAAEGSVPLYFFERR